MTTTMMLVVIVMMTKMMMTRPVQKHDTANEVEAKEHRQTKGHIHRHPLIIIVMMVMMIMMIMMTLIMILMIEAMNMIIMNIGRLRVTSTGTH